MRRARFSFGAAPMAKLRAAPSRIGTLAPRVAVPPKTAEPFYQSGAWRSLVASIKRERGNRCQRPGCMSSHRVIADHIVERKDGGADLDASNIELLCFTHHQQKTAAARQAR